MTLMSSSPTVLLVDESGNDNYLMRSWFETNGYDFRQANDVYDAFEELTDMTLEKQPSMILLNSCSADASRSWLMDSLQEFASKKNLAIINLTANNHKKPFENSDNQFIELEDFESLKPLMQNFLPVYSSLQAAA